MRSFHVTSTVDAAHEVQLEPIHTLNSNGKIWLLHLHIKSHCLMSVHINLILCMEGLCFIALESASYSSSGPSAHVCEAFCHLLLDYVEVFTAFLLNHICNQMLPTQNWCGSELLSEGQVKSWLLSMQISTNWQPKSLYIPTIKTDHWNNYECI